MSKQELQEAAYKSSGVTYEESLQWQTLQQDDLDDSYDDEGHPEGGEEGSPHRRQQNSATATTATMSHTGSSLYGRIGGEDGCRELCELFYDRVFADAEAAWFRNIFASSTKNEAVDNQVSRYAVLWIYL